MFLYNYTIFLDLWNSIYLAVSLATSSPNSFNTISKDISIPEDTPAEVIMPSSTILLSVMTSVWMVCQLR